MGESTSIEVELKHNELKNGTRIEVPTQNEQRHHEVTEW